MIENSKTLSDFISFIVAEKGLSKNTASSYHSDLSKFIEFLKKNQKQIADVNHQDITDFLWHLKTIGFKPRSIYRYTESIRQFYKFLFIENLIENDPTEHITPTKIPKDLPKMLSVEEVDILLNCINEDDIQSVRNRSMIELLYACGIRVSELVNLKSSDVNLNDDFLRIIGKGNKERLIPFGKKAKDYLLKYLSMRKPISDINDNIFISRLGKKLSRIEFWRQLKNIAIKAGINQNITPHIIRHSFASHLISKGADIRFVQEMLGHTSISTTQIYTHINNSQIKTLHKKYHPRS